MNYIKSPETKQKVDPSTRLGPTFLVCLPGLAIATSATGGQCGKAHTKSGEGGRLRNDRDVARIPVGIWEKFGSGDVQSQALDLGDTQSSVGKALRTVRTESIIRIRLPAGNAAWSRIAVVGGPDSKVAIGYGEVIVIGQRVEADDACNVIGVSLEGKRGVCPHHDVYRESAT